MAKEKEVRFKIGKRLRVAREKRELSQPALAKKARVTSYVVAVAEAGQPVTQSNVERIAKALGVQVASLRA